MKNSFLILLALFVSGTTITHADISNTQFMTNFVTHFSQQSCSKTGILRRCFRVKLQPCLKSTAVAAKHCEKTVGHAMPSHLRDSVESGIWGSKLASCISKQFSKNNKKLINQSNGNCASLKAAL